MKRVGKFSAAILSVIMVAYCMFATGADANGSTFGGNTSNSAKTLSVSLNYTTHIYTGKDIKPTMTVKLDGKKLNKSQYTVKYSNNKYIGKAKLVVSAGGKNTTSYFKIKPKTASKPKLYSKKQKQFTVTVNEDLSASGYEVKYSLYSSGKNASKFKMKNGDSLSKTVSKLKNNKTYYVWVRNYKNVGKDVYYGNYSSRQSVKVSSAAADAALPDEMLDSYILEAMKYVGYKVDAQKKAGSLLEDRASGPRTPMKYRTGIDYGGGSNGREAVKDKKTKTGWAPNVKHFKRYGLVCASFATYYYDNYLRNIAGVNTDFIRNAMKNTGYHSYSCMSWYNAARRLVKSGKATVVDKVKAHQSLPAANLKKLKIGDLVTFRIPNEGEVCGHVAVYAGTNHEGDHFVAHVGSNEGPVFQTLERFQNVINDHDGCAYSTVYRFKGIPSSRYDYTLSLDKSSYKYTGKSIKPKLTVKDAAGKKISSKYYTVYYYRNTKKGTGIVKAVFKGNYKGAKTVNFKIK